MKGKETYDYIDVLGKPYKIKLTDDIGAAGNLGLARRGKQIIILNTEGCAPEQLEETLLHEVIHIVDGELTLGLTEEAVACLSVGIYSAGYRRRK